MPRCVLSGKAYAARGGWHVGSMMMNGVRGESYLATELLARKVAANTIEHSSWKTALYPGLVTRRCMTLRVGRRELRAVAPSMRRETLTL